MPLEGRVWIIATVSICGWKSSKKVTFRTALNSLLLLLLSLNEDGVSLKSYLVGLKESK